MTSGNNSEEKVTKAEADLWNTMYSTKSTKQSQKSHYQPLGPTVGAVPKTEADLWNKLYKNVSVTGKPVGRLYKILALRKHYFSGRKAMIALALCGLTIISGTTYFFMWGGGASYVHLINAGGVAYTKNPAERILPMHAVVKIVVNDEQAGSGIIFSEDGYILTNAHVLTSPLGRNAKSIKVCYSDENVQEVHCNYDAVIIDINREEDLAVIQTNRPVAEVEPYLFVVNENDEHSAKDLVPLGTQISVVGFPGVGGGSVTLTKGIVSGYKNGETTNDDGSFQKIPYYLKTDTEINHGNSGGAAFDANNRYIGIPSSYVQDDGGKIGYIIYWNRINTFLNHLVYKGALSLPPEQYAKRITLPTENDLWGGIRDYYSDDYKLATEKLSRYTSAHPSDARGISYLCFTYLNDEDWNNLGKCSEQLRAVNPKAEALSWLLTSAYDYVGSGEDPEKAYEDINKALIAQPDYAKLLEFKARIEIDLKRFEEAEKTASSILDINDMSPTAFEVLGRVALQNEDYENAIKYFVSSFSYEPSPKLADILSTYYMLLYESDKNPENFGLALYYRVGSVVLDQKNVGYLIQLAKDSVKLFNETEGDSLGESLTQIKKLLDLADVDKELVEPILGITDDEIKSYLTEESSGVSQKDIDATRYYVKVSVAWLYTLIGEKNSCQSTFDDVMRSKIQTVFYGLGKTGDEVAEIALTSTILSCLCDNSDYSSDEVHTCVIKKIGVLK